MKTEINILIDQLNFPEGPCFDSKGRFWCTEILSGNLLCYDNGKINKYHVGSKLNGAAIDGKDRVWFTDSERNLIAVFNPETKKCTTVCDQIEGKPLGRPNDMVFDRKGNLIISCHNDGRTEPTSSLIVLDRQNRAKTIARNKYFTNGIAFAPDGKTFIYSETYNQQLWKAWWNDHKLSIIREEPFARTDGPKGPDGIAFDNQGNLYVTVFDQGKIDVINPEGRTINSIELPYNRPTSCAFLPNMKSGLIVTEAEVGLVINIKIDAKGQTVFLRNYEQTEVTF